MLVVERHQFSTLEHAKRDRRQRLGRMLHLAHDRALQADDIAWHDIIEDLTAPVLQQLVAEAPARQDSKEMSAVGALEQDCRSGVDRKLALLEGRDEIQL